MKRQKQSKIVDIVKSMMEESDLQSEIRKYFYYDSKLCRVLQDYLAKDSNPHCFFKNNRSIRNTSAHSGVHFKSASIHLDFTKHKLHKLAIDKNTPAYKFITFAFDIDLIDKDDNESNETVHISVPASWETNFSQAKLTNWIKTEKRKITNNKTAQIIKDIAIKFDVPLQVTNQFLTYI